MIGRAVKIVNAVLSPFRLAVVRKPAGREDYLRRMFAKVAHLEGDIVECGVGRMRSFRVLAAVAEADGSRRTVWAFDSFEGFPEPAPEDASSRQPRKGEWNYLDAGDVAKFLLILGFRRPWIEQHIRVVKGFFQDSLPNNEVGRIALLHLDVDLYDSYKTCLQHLFPKVVTGGIVMFDEYASSTDLEKFPGAKKAIDEYFAGTPYKISTDAASGKYFLIRS